MIEATRRSVRIQELRELIDEYGFALGDLLEDSGSDVDEFALESLTDEELEALFDRLDDLNEGRSG